MCRLFLLLTQLGYTCGELSSDVSIKRKKVLAQMRWEDYGEVSLSLSLARSFALPVRWSFDTTLIKVSSYRICLPRHLIAMGATL